MSWQHGERVDSCFTTRQQLSGCGSIRQAHRAVTSGRSRTSCAVVSRMRALGKERALTRLRGKPSGERKGVNRETGGAVPAKITSPRTETGKGSARSPSLASKGSAQAPRCMGLVRGTWVAGCPPSSSAERKACGVLHSFGQKLREQQGTHIAAGCKLAQLVEQSLFTR